VSIKQKFATSSMWLVLGASFGQLSGFIIFVMLARILTPLEFGIVAVASVFIDLSKQFLSSGVPDALIRQPEWDDSFASTAFWITVSAASVVALLAIGVGVPIAYATGHAEVGAVLAALTITLIIDAMRIVFDARLRRDFDFKRLMSREVVTQVIAGIIGIVMAVLGAGAWALVVNRIAASVLGTCATWWLVRWHPRFEFSKAHATELLRFSSGLVGAQALAALNGQVAPLVITFLLGPTSLALFRAGNRVLTMLTQVTITPLQGAALSAFSRIRDPVALAAAYVRLTGACSLIACPVFIGAGLLGPDLVMVLLGPKWQESGAIMMVSSFVVGAAALNYFFTPVLTAAGNTRYSFFYFLSAVIGNGVLAFFAAPFGTVAIAASQTARAYISLPLPLTFLRRAIGLPQLTALRSVAAPFLAAAVMGAVMAAVKWQAMASLSAPLRLALMTLLGTLVYSVLMLTFGRASLRRNFNELKPLLPAGLRRRLS